VKRVSCWILSALCAFALSGCALLEKVLPPVTEDQVTSTQAPLEVLMPEQSGRDQVAFSLYYRAGELVYMAPEVRILQNVSEEEYLSALVRELLLGPQNTGQLSPFFQEGTELVEVSQTRDYVYLTLSSEFLDAPKDAPVNWEDDPDWAAYVRQRRRLALYSLVNTVTELGTVSRVQVLVEVNGQAARVTADQVGLEAEDPAQPLEPLARVHEVIFTPEAAAQVILDAFTRKDWETVAEWVSSQDPWYGTSPDRGTIVKTLTQKDTGLLRYEILGSEIGASGGLALITVREEQQSASGTYSINESQPLRFVMDGSLWKLSHVSLEQLIQYAQ